MTEYQVRQVALLLKLCIWLVVKSDNKGLTHGEKHHFHQVTINVLAQALKEIGDNGQSLFPPNEDAPNEIPF